MKTTRSSFFDQPTKVIMVLCLIPLLLYIKSLWFGFSPLDEQWMILKNIPFLEKWSSLKDAFTQSTAGIYYRPLFNSVLIIDYHLGGVSPFMYHLSSLGLHISSVLLLHRFLLNFNTPKQTAFWLALLFSLHPVVLHSVVWIPGSNDLILAVVCLASFIYLQKYLAQKQSLFLWLHLLFFVAALFTKENALVLPVIFTAIYIVQSGFQKKELITLSLVWILIGIAWFILRKNIVDSHLPAGGGFSHNLKQFIMAMLVFTGKAIFPVQQSVFPTLKNSSLFPGILAITAVIVLWFKPGFANRKIALLGLLIFFGFLALPVWFGATNPAGEHYEQRIYVSMAGLFLFFSQLNFTLNQKAKYVYIFIAVIFGIRTFTRMNSYTDEMTFTDTGIKEAPDYYLFHLQKGDLLFDKKDYTNALVCYNKAIELRPNSAEIYNNRGHIYATTGKHKEAISDFSKSIQVMANNPDAYLNRCIAYANSNDLDNAVKDLIVLRKCCQNTIPPDVDQDITRRWSLMTLQKIDLEIERTPQNAVLYVNRARLYTGAGQPDKALADLQKACELDPDNQAYQGYLKQLKGQ